MGRSHRREPVKHTCPDIDYCLGELRVIRDGIAWVSKNTDTDVDSEIRAIDNLDSGLEQLRSSNAALREWGTEEANRVDELESQLDESESALKDLQESSDREIADLKKDVEQLTEQVSDYEDEIRELREKIRELEAMPREPLPLSEIARISS